MAKLYYDQDCDLSVLKSSTVAVIGYGSQGRAQAQNMLDSGLKVIIGLKAGSTSTAEAKADGFEVVDVATAAERADIIQILTPDQSQKEIYDAHIQPKLKAGKAIVFSHGFNIHFDEIVAPKDVDVYMVAPKGPGHLGRRVFIECGGVPFLIAIRHHETGNACRAPLAHDRVVASFVVAIL